MNNLTDFYLVGHSFGGYISGNFALRNQEHIRKLILLSPLGLRVAPEGENEHKRITEVCTAVSKLGINPPSLSMRLYMKLAWKHRVSMFDMVRTLGKR